MFLVVGDGRFLIFLLSLRYIANCVMRDVDCRLFTLSLNKLNGHCQLNYDLFVANNYDCKVISTGRQVLKNISGVCHRMPISLLLSTRNLSVERCNK